MARKKLIETTDIVVDKQVDSLPQEEEVSQNEPKETKCDVKCNDDVNEEFLRVLLARKK